MTYTGRVVVWDSHCSFCRRSARLLAALDWLHEHEYVGSAEPGALDDPRITAADADRAVQLLTEAGRFEGYDAIRRILLRCPPTCWFAPLMWLPGVRPLGERVYRRVAERRTCGIGSNQQPPLSPPRFPWFLTAVVMLQLLIPLVALAQGIPSRYGWHMFTGRGALKVEVLDADGKDFPVDPRRWVVDLREELDWTPLAVAVCRDIPDAAEVRITVRSHTEVTDCSAAS